MLRCPICRFNKPYPKYKVKKYQYYECKNCETLFTCPLPTKKTINAYYSDKFEYTAGIAEESRIRKRAKIILKRLKQLCPEGKTLLDIGSGYGYFLEEAEKLKLKTVGIEPSRKLYVQSIKRLYTSLVINTDLLSFFKENQDKKFDSITAIHVIEHVLNPFQFIRQASQLLNRNGILYIETPNYDSWLARAEKEKYTFLTPPDHICLFSLKSLQLIVAKTSSLRLDSYSTYSYPEHFMGIIKRKFQILNPKSQTNPKSKILNTKQLDIRNSNLFGASNLEFRISDFKYLLFDKLLAPLFTPFLNCANRGSILQLYLRRLD